MMLDEIPSWVFSVVPNATIPSVDFMTPGNRNTDLTSMAGFLRRSRGLSAEAIELQLITLNAAAPNPVPIDEVSRIAKSVARYDVFGAADMRDLPLSQLLASQLRATVRHTTAGQWMVYDGKRWQLDRGGIRAKEALCRWMRVVYDAIMASGDDGRVRLATSLLSRTKINSVFSLLNADPDIIVSDENFDLAPDLINFENGTFDLSVMQLRDHSPDDLLTIVAPCKFDPAASCPTFDRFLADVLPTDLGEFVLRLLGYGLTGRADEHLFAIFLGAGRNGKTTLANVISEVFGDYAANADPSTFIRKKFERVSADIARLKNKRFVTTSEISKGDILDAALMKRMTGGDKITTRHYFKDYFEMEVKSLIVMSTNALPVIDGGDKALAKRIAVVPFTRNFEASEIDPNLGKALSSEASGILNRIIAGLEDYREKGLDVPAEVQAAAARYVDSADLLAQFLEDYTTIAADQNCGAKELYRSYVTEMQSLGLTPMSSPIFKTSMEAKGYKQHRTAAKKVWLGLRLLSPIMYL